MAQSSPAVVAAVTGRAWTRNADGSLTELHAGSRVPEGAEVVTAPGATVQLQVEGGLPVAIGGDREVAMNADMTRPVGDVTEAKVAQPAQTDSDRLLAALEAGEDPFADLEATAASLGGGGEGEGSSFVRLMRIVEATTPLSLEYGNPGRAVDDLFTPAAGDRGANEPPLALDDTARTPEDAPVRGNILSNDSDPDGDALTLVSVGGQPMAPGGITVPGSNGGTFTILPDGSYIFDPAGQFESLGNGQTATSSIRYTISDADGATSSATLTVTVTGLNDAPVADDQRITTPEDTPISGTVTGQDPDGDPLTYTLDEGPQHGTLEFHPDGSYTYTPDPDYNGPDQFTVIVDDGQGGTTTATVDIGVTPVNDPPVAPDQTIQTPEETPVSGAVTGTDVDGDDLTYAVDTGPEHGTLEFHSDGSYTYTPEKDYNGPDRFTVIVDDGQGGTTTATVNIGVTPVLDIPTLHVEDAGTVHEGEAMTFRLNVDNTVDIDGDTLVTLQLTGGQPEDFEGLPTIVFSQTGQQVTATDNGDGTYSFVLPQNAVDGDILVSFQTHDDQVFEGRESFQLDATLSGDTSSGPLPDGITGTGTGAIRDDEAGFPGADRLNLQVSDPGTVNEGSDVVFNVGLDKAVDADTTLTFTLDGEFEADDINGV